MDALYLVFAVLIFVAVVLLLEGIYLSWSASRGPEAKRLAQRLRLISAGAAGQTDEISILKTRLLSQTPWFERLLLLVPRIQRLDRVLAQSGLSWSVADLIGLSLLAAAGGFGAALYLSLGAATVALVGGAAGALPCLHVVSARSKRISRIEQSLPDALDLIGRALRAGHAFPNAVKMVGDEMADPIGGEFRIVFDEINYGIPMQGALTNLAARVPVPDLRYFVIAVLIQRETGGNLAELLDNISGIIRGRLKLLGQVRVLSAEGRMSAWVLTLLPFALAFVIETINPKFLGVLWTDPLGREMVGGAAALMVFGIFWMWRIIKIRV